MTTNIGVGLHTLDIDITTPAGEVGSFDHVEAIIMDDDEQISSHTADAATIHAAPLTDGSAHLYTATVKDLACLDVVKTYLRFTHQFAARGNCRIALRFHLASGHYVTTTTAIRLAVSDGLYKDSPL